MIKIYYLCANLVNFTDMALPPRDQRHQYLRYEGLLYTDADIVDFETRLTRIYRREVHKVQVFDFEGLPDLMAEGLRGRMLMKNQDAQGKSFGLYWGESARQIPNMGDLSAYWIGISSARDFMGTPPSYTLINDPIMRLCHILITYSIIGRSQAPKKVTVTNLFYLRGMDVYSVNVPYLLAKYLRLFSSRRKQGAMIFGGQYVARLAKHFGLFAEKTLGINSPRLERQSDVAAGVPEATKDAPVADEGALAIPVLVQALQMPPPAVGPTQTMAQRLAKVDEDVHEIHGALGKQREILDNMAYHISRFST
ncbi:hypothetical protein Tco_1524191 [Tanacetum coccineum]